MFMMRSSHPVRLTGKRGAFLRRFLEKRPRVFFFNERLYENAFIKRTMKNGRPTSAKARQWPVSGVIQKTRCQRESGFPESIAV
jgi:hypothetical protein